MRNATFAFENGKAFRIRDTNNIFSKTAIKLLNTRIKKLNNITVNLIDKFISPFELKQSRWYCLHDLYE